MAMLSEALLCTHILAILRLKPPPARCVHIRTSLGLLNQGSPLHRGCSALGERIWTFHWVLGCCACHDSAKLRSSGAGRTGTHPEGPVRIWCPARRSNRQHLKALEPTACAASAISLTFRLSCSFSETPENHDPRSSSWIDAAQSV